MAQPVSTQPEMPAILPGRKLASAIVVGGAALGAVVLAGALGLWFHYGTAVFFEMITSGISACF
jgi:ABC-type proline/glycine betaine transport system permease subunit